MFSTIPTRSAAKAVPFNDNTPIPCESSGPICESRARVRVIGQDELHHLCVPCFMGRFGAEECLG